MSSINFCLNRAVLHLGGGDVTQFLDRLVTTRLPDAERSIRFSALLTPQGKILFDFFLYRAEDGYWLDCSGSSADDLIKRLTFYKLRADVTITDRREDLALAIVEDAQKDALALGADPRHPELPSRAIFAETACPAEQMPGDSIRVQLGIPEAGADYQYGATFPHDAGFDNMGGVDLDKGCFVGQEVVSRMAHRGTARRRPVQIHSSRENLQVGSEIWAGNKVLGKITSASKQTGLSILRIDRAADAVAAGSKLVVGDESVRLTRPDWASYDWPEELD